MAPPLFFKTSICLMSKWPSLRAAISFEQKVLRNEERFGVICEKRQKFVVIIKNNVIFAMRVV